MDSSHPSELPTQEASNENRLMDEIVGHIEEEEADSQHETITASGSKKRKAQQGRSPLWQDFTRVPVMIGDPLIQVFKAKCNRCAKLIAAHGTIGTNGMKNHLKACVKNEKDGQGQTMLNYTQSTDGSGSLTTWKFDQKAIRLALCEMIIVDELPFIFVEREGFKKFVARLCPQFQIPTRKTIREDCIKMFLNHKEKLKIFFLKKGMGRVSITTDCWTSVNNTNFICVTAHCIGKDWTLHKKIISFTKIVSHKAADIGASIVSTLREWGLQNVFCCTLDNAASNNGAVDCVKSYLDTWNKNILAGKYVHMRCAAHILNLIVSDGLEEIGSSVRRVREAVKWMKASPARYTQFQDCVTLLRDRIICKKSLSLDVPTRWNSTYLMLESALPYEEAFKLFPTMYQTSTYVEDLKQKKHNGTSIGHPDAIDWLNVKKMIEYLKKFYELTLLVSDTTYATSHLFFVKMCDIFDLISELENNDDFEISSMASKMRSKIGKYWLEESELNPRMNKILYIAALLDPRQKMKHVEKCFKLLYQPSRAATLVSDVTDSMNELFEFYKGQALSSTLARTTTSASMRSHGRSDRRGSISLVGVLDSDEESEDTSELALYLTEKQYKVPKNEVDEFDILQWWSKNSPQYPVLSEMARDILAIPISSVASEQAFSTGGRVLCSERSSLAPSTVEAMICAEDWLKTSSIVKTNEEGVSEEELEKEFQMVLRAVGVGLGASSTTESAQSQSGPGISSFESRVVI